MKTRKMMRLPARLDDELASYVAAAGANASTNHGFVTAAAISAIPHANANACTPCRIVHLPRAELYHEPGALIYMSRRLSYIGAVRPPLGRRTNGDCAANPRSDTPTVA